MKVYLSFNDNSEEDKMKLKDMMQATKMSCALHDVGQEIFRPARKHGYNDSNINELIEKIGEDATELISLLEDKFYTILRERGVELE